MAEGEDRTEAPSAKKLQQARSEGNVAISRELGTVVMLSAAGGVAMATFPGAMVGLQAAMRGILGNLATIDVAQGGLQAALALMVRRGMLPFVPVIGAAGLAAIAIGLFQSGLLLRLEALMPDVSRVSPVRGLTRIFGGQTLVDAGKSALKLVAFGLVMEMTGRDALRVIYGLGGLGPDAILSVFGGLLRHAVVGMLAVQGGIALLDVGWTRHQHLSKLKMSRQDLRDEHKESEGDPHIKGRLRQLRARRSRRRMMDAVPSAAVVITNPTHYAVALAYEPGGNAAPKVVAKGVDEVAARIREMARAHNVPLVPSPPLARALHKLDLDAEIPREHFQAVAAIIAFVWKQKRPAQRRPAAGPAAGAPRPVMRTDAGS